MKCLSYIIETLIIPNTSYQKTVTISFFKKLSQIRYCLKTHLVLYLETEHPHWIIARKIENGTLVVTGWLSLLNSKCGDCGGPFNLVCVCVSVLFVNCRGQKVQKTVTKETRSNNLIWIFAAQSILLLLPLCGPRFLYPLRGFSSSCSCIYYLALRNRTNYQEFSIGPNLKIYCNS